MENTLPYHNLGNWNFDLPKKKFSVALLASIAVHLLLAWMVTFDVSAPPIPEKKTPQIMDVVLLDESKNNSQDAPNHAKTIANKNNQGNQQNAQDDENRAARSPGIAAQDLNRNKPQPLLPQQPRTPPIPSQQNKKNTRMLTRDDENTPSLLPPDIDFSEEHKTTTTPAPFIPLSNLLPSSTALTQLSREFDRERHLKDELSEGVTIGFNTREAKYVKYVNRFAASVEENFNFIEENQASLDDYFNKNPQNKNLHLWVKISIKRNGELIGLKIIQPSPNPEYNRSVIAAINKAAPFQPLPDDWNMEDISININFYTADNFAKFR